MHVVGILLAHIRTPLEHKITEFKSNNKITDFRWQGTEHMQRMRDAGRMKAKQSWDRLNNYLTQESKK
jgi:hypothetical protein